MVFAGTKFMYHQFYEIQCTTKGIYIYIRDVISNYENDKMKSQQTSHFPLISLFTKIETNGNK